MGEVIVVGSINTDLVTYVEKLPEKGETVTGGTFKSFPGGKGANQAVAAAKAGASVLMYGAVGDDSYGRERVESLWEHKVSTDGIVVKKGIHSGIAQIIVDKMGENIIAVASGANYELRPSDIDSMIPDKKKAVALFQNELRQYVTERLIIRTKEKGYRVIWNTAPAPSEHVGEDVFSSLDFLVCNEGELSLLAGKTREIEKYSEDFLVGLAESIIERGVGSVIVTMGSSGSILIDKGGVYKQRAYSVKAIDTVGAGDCFCGVFAASIAEGFSVKESLERSAKAAAISVTREGAQTSMPLSEEIDSFNVYD